MTQKSYFLLFLLSFSVFTEIAAYPIDGYLLTGIRRLLWHQLVEKGELKGRKRIEGAKKSIKDIQLNLVDSLKKDSLFSLMYINNNTVHSMIDSIIYLYLNLIW